MLLHLILLKHISILTHCLVIRKRDQSCEHQRIYLSHKETGLCVKEKSVCDCCPEVHNPFTLFSQHTLVCMFSC